MGVIFQNGFGVGTMPNTFGGSGLWLLQIGNQGCQPAWDNGTFNFFDWVNHNCDAQTDMVSAFNSYNSDLYINGQDSNGNNHSNLLTGAIGQTGTIRFTQGSTYVELGFNPSSGLSTNTYSSSTGLYFHFSGLTLNSYNNGVFVGYDGNGTPNNSQLVQITLNY